MALTGASGSGGKQQVARRVASVQRARALVPSGTRLKKTGAEEVDWAGSTRRAIVAGKAQVLLSSSLISVF